MADITIQLPTPGELVAPLPVRRGIVHEYYYTGEVTEPIWYEGRPLWDVRYRYGVQSIAKGESVEHNINILLNAGQAFIPLPIPFSGNAYSRTVSITPNYSENTITFSSSVVSALDDTMPIQIGRYCLVPTGAVTSTKIAFQNMPDSGLPTTALVQQGEQYWKVLVRKINTEPAIVHKLSRYICRIDDLIFKEVR